MAPKINITSEERKLLESLRDRLTGRSETSAPYRVGGNVSGVDQSEKNPVTILYETPNLNQLPDEYWSGGSHLLSYSTGDPVKTADQFCLQMGNGNVQEFEAGNPVPMGAFWNDETGWQINGAQTLPRIVNLLCQPSEQSDDDDIGILSTCDPAENGIGGGGLNQTCIELNNEYPYCNEDGNCVQCLDDNDCPESDAVRVCIDYQCNPDDDDDTQQPNSCNDPAALNFVETGTYECISDSTQCNAFFNAEFGQTYSGEFLISDCCCYNLDGVIINSSSGDLNNDGLINILDVVQLVNAILNDNEESLIDPFYLPPYVGDGETGCDYSNYTLNGLPCSSYQAQDVGTGLCTYLQTSCEGYSDPELSDGSNCNPSDYLEPNLSCNQYGDCVDFSSSCDGYTDWNGNCLSAGQSCNTYGDCIETGLDCVNYDCIETGLDCGEYDCIETGLDCGEYDCIDEEDCENCLFGCMDPSACTIDGFPVDFLPLGLYHPDFTKDCAGNIPSSGYGDTSCCKYFSETCTGGYSGDIGPCNCEGSGCSAHQYNFGNGPATDGGYYVYNTQVTECGLDYQPGQDCNGNCGAPNSGALIRACGDCPIDDGSVCAGGTSCDCSTLDAWEAFRDGWDDGVCNPNYACYEVAQPNGEVINFQCGMGRCLDQCGDCRPEGESDPLWNSECGDCAGVVDGQHALDGYALADSADTITFDGTYETGGCCIGSTKLLYFDDSDGDGYGEGDGYLMCPDNPNIAQWGLVTNNIDLCLGGSIDQCGCCWNATTNTGIIVEGYPNAGDSCEENFCIGCIDDTACNYDDNATIQLVETECTYPAECFDCDGDCICTTDTDCDCGVLKDECGECGGSNTSCLDCNDVINGPYDYCTDESACNNGECVDGGNSGCIYPDMYYDCAGSCLNDSDSDGICDELEVEGCTDPQACNYQLDATDDNATCYFANKDNDGIFITNYNGETIPAPNLLFLDCNGNCLVDVDGDETCDGNEIEGCTDSSACNYSDTATEDDGSCYYAPGVTQCFQDTDDDGDYETAINVNLTCDQTCSTQGYSSTYSTSSGCTSAAACNYNSLADLDDGSCVYPTSGHCWSDPDEDGYHEQDEGIFQFCPGTNGLGLPSNCAGHGTGWADTVGLNPGCTDSNACNYEASADQDDGSCTYPDAGFACNGNCLVDVDCAGVCGGSSELDACGSCGGTAVWCDDDLIAYDGDCSNGGTYCDCSNHVEDGCGNCDGIINPVDWVDINQIGETCDCAGNTWDNCGVCNGLGYTCQDASACNFATGCDACTYPTWPFDCNNVCIATGINLNYTLDANSNVIPQANGGYDCAGVCGGAAVLDRCLVCNGDGTTCAGCTYDGASNYNPDAEFDDGSCSFPLIAESDSVTLNGELITPSDPSTQFEEYSTGFYYPYNTKLALLDNIHKHIWLKNPAEECVESDGSVIRWRDCDMSGVPTLDSMGSVLRGDKIKTFTPDGFAQFATKTTTSWNVTSQDTNDTDFGNTSDTNCSTTISGTCVDKGFIGRLGLNIEGGGVNCDPTDCQGDCPQDGGGIYSIDGFGRQCSCGVRLEMLECYGVIGWLKFKEEII